MSFLDLLEESYQELSEATYGDILDYLAEEETLPEDTLSLMKEAFDLNEEEEKQIADFISEQIVKRVSARGEVSKTLDRKTRSRRATQTTSLSRTQLKQRAKAAARTRRFQGTERKNVKKRNKANRVRKQRGIKSGS